MITSGLVGMAGEVAIQVAPPSREYSYPVTVPEGGVKAMRSWLLFAVMPVITGAPGTAVEVCVTSKRKLRKRVSRAPPLLNSVP